MFVEKIDIIDFADFLDPKFNYTFLFNTLEYMHVIRKKIFENDKKKFMTLIVVIDK